jgi:CP family cyanate transporter-like MFS transporter
VAAEAHPRAAPARQLALGAAFVLVAFNLRPAIAAVSPLLPTIRAAERLSPTEGGLLTSLPLVCFGVLAFVAPRFLRRHGPSPVLLVCLVGLGGGIALRSAPSVGALFAGTLLLGAAIGTCNVLMPVVLKDDFPRGVALMTGLYTAVLTLGPSVAGGTTIPLERALGGSWRLALGFWVIPVAAGIACWLPFRGREAAAGTQAGEPDRLHGLWRSGTAWAITAFMGLQSLNFYTVLTWLPTILQRRGVSLLDAGTLLAILNLAAIVASLAAPSLSERVGNLWTTAVAGAALNAAGTAGILLDGRHLQVLWVVLLGLGQGTAISLAIMMMVVRTADSRHTSSISGMAQGVGYLFAACGPVAAGAVFDASGRWSVPLVALIVLLVAQGVAAWVVGRSRSRLGEARAVVDLSP